MEQFFLLQNMMTIFILLIKKIILTIIITVKLRMNILELVIEDILL